MNAAGMRMYNQAIVMSDKRQHLCTIDGNVVTEKYEGRNTRGYIGEYTTDGSNCNCSWFAAKYICRHLIYYRVTKNLPIFETRSSRPMAAKRDYKNKSLDISY